MYIGQVGQGFPVVFLHGSPTPAEMLEPIGQALSMQRTALFVHTPGYGRSPSLPRAPEGPTMTAIQQEIERTL